jgi:hypothetical protein
MTALTTPKGLPVHIDRGTLLRTDKGLYVIFEASPDEVKFVPIKDAVKLSMAELQNLVNDGRVKL